MALLSVIRRWHFREGMPIREIERRTCLSRNTVRKYLRAGTVEPQFKVPERPSKLDPFAEKLSGWLRVEAGRSRKQRRTVKQMHADLVTLGYDGSYNRVAAFARRDLASNRMVAYGGDLIYEDECFVLDLKFNRRYTTYLYEHGATTVLLQFTFKTVGQFSYRAL